MKNSFAETMQVHPMIVFWLGLLTGALAVGLLFFYRTMNPANFQSALLRSTTLDTRSTTLTSPTYTSPTATYTEPTTSLYPTPTGSLQAYPTPTGS